MEITQNTTFTYTYTAKEPISQTVTFQVVNGSWNNESTDSVIMELEGWEGDTLKLPGTEAIPAAGEKPSTGYKAGSWDVTPVAGMEITQDTTFTYTYLAKEKISRQVTFQVVNGSWNDETTTAVPVTLEGWEGDTLTLPGDKIPAVGNKPNDKYKEGSWDVTPAAGMEITQDTTFTYTYFAKEKISRDVTFQVVNGSWNDETTTAVPVTLEGLEGDTLTLPADKIPAVGAEPAKNYKEGSWDVTPVGDMVITQDTIFTYTYAAREPISRTVTFQVVNGSWNDETTTPVPLTLEGLEGDTLTLPGDKIPAVGNKPNDKYKEGSWDVTPVADMEITQDTTFTYTYAAKGNISWTVTFQVVNGSWNNESTEALSITLEGLEGDKLTLPEDKIPAVGAKPADGHQAGLWNTEVSAGMEITQDTTFTYTYNEIEKISRAVTFQVVNGSWADGSTGDKTVTLTGPAGSTLKLTADDIPAVGDKPAQGFKAGSWNDNLEASLVKQYTTFIYTYAARESISRKVTFYVNNGSWNDKTWVNKEVTLKGLEGDKLTLAETDIPAVGNEPDAGYKAGSWDVTPSVTAEIEKNTSYTYTYVRKEPVSRTVTFRVVKGSWNDGTTAEKIVTLEGLEGDALTLAKGDIPAAGSEPDEGYKEGSWDVTPSTDAKIEADTVCTYTYAQKEPVSVTVTFRVKNGSWDDETTVEKTVTLKGLEGDALQLAEEDIPDVGTCPAEGYKAGGWDLRPAAGAEIRADSVFTYTFIPMDSVSRTVTFVVVNGSWDDGSSEAKEAMVSGPESSALKLTADQIPAVGSNPEDGYKAGAWDVTPSADAEITENTVFTYTYAAKEKKSVTVTFQVVNGQWDDGETEGKTVTLEGLEGDQLMLAETDIPAAGENPDAGYKEGSWEPALDTGIEADTVFIYTYAAKKTISVTVTFRVVNGRWNSGTTTDQRKILTGDEGDSLMLSPNDFPGAGVMPDEGCTTGSWNVLPALAGEISENTVFVYTYAVEPRIELDLGLEIVGLEEVYEYTGKSIKPSFRVEDNGKVLALGTDYSVSYGNNKKIGTATVIVKGKGNYKDYKAEATFEIQAKPVPEGTEFAGDVKKIKVASSKKLPYNGLLQYPDKLEITLRDKSIVIMTHLGDGQYSSSSDKSIGLTFSNNRNVGTAYVAAFGSDGKYQDTTFKIMRVPISEAILPSDVETDWSTKIALPKLHITWKNGAGEELELVEGQDYKVSFKAKKSYYYVTGKGNFNGKVNNVPFKINPFRPERIDAVYAYDGVKVKKITVAILDRAGKSLTKKMLNVKVLDSEGSVMDGSTRLNAGDKITIVVTSNNPNVQIDEPGLSTTLTIGGKLNSTKVNIDKGFTRVYTGEPIELTNEDMRKIHVVYKKTTELVYGEDFVIAGYTNNIKKGSMTVTIAGTGEDHGRGAWNGTKTFKVKIVTKNNK